MSNVLAARIFAASEATEIADLVADHDPESPRTITLLPKDESAAEAGVLALVERLHGLPKSIRSALKRAADSAGCSKSIGESTGGVAPITQAPAVEIPPPGLDPFPRTVLDLIPKRSP